MSTEPNNNEAVEITEDLEVRGDEAEDVAGGRLILMEKSEFRAAVKERHFKRV